MLSLRVFNLPAFVALTLLYCGSNASAESAQPPLKIVWERSFGEGDRKYAIGATAPTSGGVWIAGTVADNVHKVTTVWLWRIDQQGEKMQEVAVPGLSKRPEGVSDHEQRVEGLSVLGDGSLLVLVYLLGEERHVVIKVAPDGKMQFVKDLVQHEVDVAFAKMIATTDGKFLLIGRQYGVALAMKIDATGEVLWRKTFDRRQPSEGNTERFLTWFIDGIATTDGGAVVTGDVGGTEKYYLDQGGIWIVKLDGGGNVVAELDFSGRQGRMAHNQGREYVIAYDKSRADNRELWVRAVDADLKLLWESHILADNWGATPGLHDIVSVPGGGTLVVTTKKLVGFWIVGVGEDGKKGWEFVEEINILKHRGPLRSPLNFTVFSGDTFVIVYPIMSGADIRVATVKFTVAVSEGKAMGTNQTQVR